MLSYLARPTVVLMLAVSCCASSFAQEPKGIGIHDVVVYEPGVHDRGLPKVLFDKLNERNEQNGTVHLGVEIPPTVHVHRYYYSGDKEVQGPIIAGGPTVVVANHPHTGKQMFIDVVLPSGAPIIAYSKHGITYVYPDKRVGIKFRKYPFDTDAAFIENHSGRGIGRRFNEHIAMRHQHVKQHLQQSSAVEAIKSANQNAHNALREIGKGTGQFLGQVHDTAKAAISVIPGVSPLLNPSSEGQSQSYLSKVRAAGQRSKRTATEWVPTNR